MPEQHPQIPPLKEISPIHITISFAMTIIAIPFTRRKHKPTNQYHRCSVEIHRLVSVTKSSLKMNNSSILETMFFFKTGTPLSSINKITICQIQFVSFFIFVSPAYVTTSP